MPTQTQPNPSEALQTQWLKDLPALTEEPSGQTSPSAAPTEKGKENDGQADADGTDSDAPAPEVGAGDKGAAPKTEKVAEPAKAKAEAEPIEEKWPRSAQQWKQFKEARAKELSERDATIAALKAEVEGAKKKSTEPTAPPPELDALKKERDEYSNRLRLLDVERHPKFQAYYTGKVNAQVEMAKRIVGPDKADAAAKIVTLPESAYRDAQVEELMLDLTPLQQSRLAGVLNAVSEIEADKQSEISKARENYDKMLSEQKTEQESRQAKIQQQFKETALKIQESNPVFQKRQDDAEWNKAVEDRIAQAERLFFGKDTKVEDVMQAAFNAAALPAILTSFEAMHAENEQLKKQVEELSQSSPKISSASETERGGPQAVPIKVGMRPQDATAAWVKSVTTSE